MRRVIVTMSVQLLFPVRHCQGFAELAQFTGFVMQGGVGAPGHDIEVVSGIMLLDLILVVANHAGAGGYYTGVSVTFPISQDFSPYGGKHQTFLQNYNWRTGLESPWGSHVQPTMW